MNDDSAVQTASYGRRAAAYWSVDGLADILRGLAIVVLGFLASFWRVYEPTARAGVYAFIVFGGLALYFFLFERAVLDLLKARLTYPRTGYAQSPDTLWGGHHPQDSLITLRSERPYSPSYFKLPTKENATYFWPRTARPLIWFAFLCLMILDLMGQLLTPVAMPALAVMLYVANRNSERPFPWWSALILALSGSPFLWIAVPAPFQLTLPLLLAGAWLFAQGAYTLAGYLRANPLPHASEGAKA